MMPEDVESMVRNLNDRVTRVEQILPTLATKRDLEPLATKVDDLKAEFEATKIELKSEMKALFEEARRHALVLHEDLKSQVGMIAEHLAEVMSRLPPRRH